MTGLELHGRPVLGVRSLPRANNTPPCLLPGPRTGEVCSLPRGHQPADQHAVEVLAFVTIDRFTSDLENPMTEQPDLEALAAAEQRAHQQDRTAKPRDPRSRRAGQHGAVPPEKPDQR